MRHPLFIGISVGSVALLMGALGCDSDDTRGGGTPLSSVTTTSTGGAGQGGGSGGGQQGGGGAGTGGASQGGGGGTGGTMTSDGECIATFCEVLVQDSACESCIQDKCSYRLSECLNDTGAGQQNCELCAYAWQTADTDGLCDVSGDRYQLLYECVCGDSVNPSSHGFCG